MSQIFKLIGVASCSSLWVFRSYSYGLGQNLHFRFLLGHVNSSIQLNNSRLLSLRSEDSHRGIEFASIFNKRLYSFSTVISVNVTENVFR